MSKGVQLLRDSTATLLGEVGVGIAVLINGVVIARATGADGKGVFTLITTAGQLGAALLGLRWYRAVGHFVAREEKNLWAGVLSSLLVTCVSLALAGLLLGLWPGLVGVLLRGAPPGSGTLVWWLIGAQSLSTCIAAVYGGKRSFGLRAAFLIVSAAPLIVPCLILFASGATSIGEYAKWYVATLVAVTFGWFVVLAARTPRQLHAFKSTIRAMGRYASWAYVSTVFDLVTARLDVFLLNYFTSPGAVGLYSVAVGLAGRLGILPNVVGHVVFNRASANEIGAGAATAQLFRLNALVMALAGVVAACIGSLLIVPLYGAEFARAVTPLYVMIPATICWGLYRLLAADLEGRGMPGVVSACSGAATLCVVILDVMWIPRFGVMGASWASCIAYAMALSAVGVAFCWRTGLSVTTVFRPTRADITLLLGLCGARRGRLTVGSLGAAGS